MDPASIVNLCEKNSNQQDNKALTSQALKSQDSYRQAVKTASIDVYT